MKRLIISSFILLFVVVAFAQEPPPPPPMPMPEFQEEPEHRGKKMEMMKMWKMTDFLDLTEAQAEKFFPRYKALSKELEELNKQQIEKMKKIGESIKEEKKIEEKEIDKVIEIVSNIERKKIEKKQKFVKELGDILTPEQKAKYIVFEVRFKTQLRDVIREHKRMMPGKPEHDRRRMKKMRP